MDATELFPELPASPKPPRQPRNYASQEFTPFVIVRSIGETPTPGTFERAGNAGDFWADHIATRPDFDPDKEHLFALMLNTKGKLKSVHLVSMGGLNVESISIEACPNGRDYYPQGADAFLQARAEHVARLDQLDAIRAQLDQLAKHCADFIF